MGIFQKIKRFNLLEVLSLQEDQCVLYVLKKITQSCIILGYFVCLLEKKQKVNHFLMTTYF